jgi:nitric-oxide synthase
MTMATSKSFIKANSQSEIPTAKKLDRLDSLRGSVSEPLLEDTFGPLSNVR